MRRKSINTGIGKINILICGLPGSGKITLPKKLQEQLDYACLMLI